MNSETPFRNRRLNEMLAVSSIIENAPEVVERYCSVAAKPYLGNSTGGCSSNSHSGNSSHSASRNQPGHENGYK